MKRFVGSCIGMLGAAMAWGQGLLHFSNLAGLETLTAPGEVMASIYLAEPTAIGLEKHGNTPAGVIPGTQSYGGGLVAGTNYTAQLWAGPAWCDEDQLSPVGTTTFQSGTGAGYVMSLLQSRAVPGARMGERATCQLRAWYNRSGQVTSWDQVLADPTLLRGKSTMFNLPFPLSGGLLPPPNLQGLESFNLHTASVPIAPQIGVQPQGQVVDTGQAVILSVAAFGSDPLSYQWRFNGTNLPGQTRWRLVLDPVEASHLGDYTVLVSNPAGAVLSAKVTLAVRAAPVVVRQPISTARYLGESAVVQVAVLGTMPLAYRWYRQGIPLTDGAKFIGARSAALLIANLEPADAGAYVVAVTNAHGSVSSREAVVSVLVASTGEYPPLLNMIRSGTGLELFWNLPGTRLQEANQVEGPWRDVSDTSPVHVSLTAPVQFYRVRSE